MKGGEEGNFLTAGARESTASSLTHVHMIHEMECRPMLIHIANSLLCENEIRIGKLIVARSVLSHLLFPSSVSMVLAHDTLSPHNNPRNQKGQHAT